MLQQNIPLSFQAESFFLEHPRLQRIITLNFSLDLSLHLQYLSLFYDLPILLSLSVIRIGILEYFLTASFFGIN